MSLLMDALKKAEQAKKKATQHDRIVAVEKGIQSQQGEVSLTAAMQVSVQKVEKGIINPQPDVEKKPKKSLSQTVIETPPVPDAADDLSNLDGLTLVELSELDETLVVEFLEDQESRESETPAPQDELEFIANDKSLVADSDSKKESEFSVKEKPMIRASGNNEVVTLVAEGGSRKQEDNNRVVVASPVALSVEPVSTGKAAEPKFTPHETAVVELSSATPMEEPGVVTATSSSDESPRVEAPFMKQTPKFKTPPVIGVGANKTPRRQQVWIALIIIFLLATGGIFSYFNAVLDGEAQRASDFSVVSAVEKQEADQAMANTATKIITPIIPKAPVKAATKPSVAMVAEASLPTAAIAAQPKKSPVVTQLSAEKQSTTVKQPENRASNHSTAIQVTRTERRDPLEAVLQVAYQAYQNGSYQAAEDKYRQALRLDGGNRDARLGLAVIAQRTGRVESARTFYKSLLALNPKDSIALTGLMSLPGNSGTKQNESHIKLLLDQEPAAAHLHFSLGIEYVAQGRWPEAQQSFFQAYRSAPENADYNHNLAVSLEQLSQPRAALDYYHRARQLATGQLIGFDIEQLDQRIARLSAAEGVQ